MLVLATCLEWSKGHLRCTLFVRVGSNPTVANYNKVGAQWLAHLPSKQGVAGSNPAKGKFTGKIGWRRIRIHWGER